MTRLVTEDTITEDLREKVAGVHPMVRELVECPWCVGVWAAAGILITDRVAPVVVDMLAIAQAGSMTVVLTEKVTR